MTYYYRILLKTYRKTPLGYGTNAARWNANRTPMIYAAQSIALSMVEFMSIKGGAVLNSNWVMAIFQINELIPHLEVESLPDEWDARPHPLSTQNFGSNWATSKVSVCLKIPSARLPLLAYPTEHNILINPLHPDFAGQVHIHSVEDLHFNLNEWATGKK